MTIYNVLQPPPGKRMAQPGPADFAFVKEGISWPALFIAAIWLLWHRMWLVFIFYVLAALAIGVAAERLPEAIGWVPAVCFAILFALEANNLRRWTLERSGYRLIGVAAGDNLAEAELRYFSLRAEAAGARPQASSSAQPVPAQPTQRPLLPPSPPSEPREIVGLFPRPGGGTP